MRVRCGNCNELYDIYSSAGGQVFTCSSCGSVLQMPETDGKSVEDLKLCPNCRKLIDATAVVCQFCGEVMLEEPEKESTKIRAVYILLAVVLGTLGIHNFYAGRWKCGIAQLILSLSVILTLISFVWVLYDIFSVRDDGSGLRMK